MDIIYLLLPVALIIVLVIIGIFFWAVRSDQFDDLEGPAYRILMDDDSEQVKTKNKALKTNGSTTDKKVDPDS
jgi:cbb3-type cytochrome oxidase maturation protein